MEHGNAKRDNYYLPEGLWKKTRNLIAIIGVIAWLLTIVGAFADSRQFFFSYITAFWFCTVIVVGGMFWTFIQFVSGAAASAAFRRIMENIAVCVPLAALLFIPLIFGMHDLYTWANTTVVQNDPVLLERGAFFNPTIFTIRAFIYIGILSFFALKVYRHATRIDATTSIIEGLAESKKAERWGAPGLVFVFLVATMIAWEWIMSLDARAFSTIFGVYCLANGALACIAAIVYGLDPNQFGVGSGGAGLHCCDHAGCSLAAPQRHSGEHD